jgi:four helix bundle protein
MGFKFEKLTVWKMAMDYGEDINLLTEKFPAKELYNLVSQSLRAADSIALNLAEGSLGQSDPEQRKFVGYAVRSLAEVITCLHKAHRRNYITQGEFDQHYKNGENLMIKLNAFRNSIG